MPVYAELSVWAGCTGGLLHQWSRLGRYLTYLCTALQGLVAGQQPCLMPYCSSLEKLVMPSCLSRMYVCLKVYKEPEARSYAEDHWE